jgi:hypothetical protein
MRVDDTGNAEEVAARMVVCSPVPILSCRDLKKRQNKINHG